MKIIFRGQLSVRFLPPLLEGGERAGGSVKEKSEPKHLCLDEVTDVVLGRVQFNVPHSPRTEAAVVIVLKAYTPC